MRELEERKLYTELNYDKIILPYSTANLHF